MTKNIFCQDGDKKDGKTKTTVHIERFEDFAKNAFAVTISKVQQAALNKAGGRLPTPAEQLALVNQRRSAKKAREAKTKHNLCIILEILISPQIVSIHYSRDFDFSPEQSVSKILH